MRNYIEMGKKNAISVDIGGTNIRTALVNSDGLVSHSQSISTLPEKGIEKAAERLTSLIKNTIDIANISKNNISKTISGIGISTAGPVNPLNGKYSFPPNLPTWHEKSFIPILERKLPNLPVFVGHDATLAALAETSFGENKNTKNLIYVTISTGVGGGIIADGKMVTGATGQAGELGHILVRSDGIKCNVGCLGCFEGNASGPAIKKLAEKKYNDFPIGNEINNDFSPESIIDNSKNGDVFAENIVIEVLENIAQGLSSILNIFEPEILVIGGGVTWALKHRLDEIIEMVSYTALPRYRKKVPIKITSLGENVSLLGAAQLIFRQPNTKSLTR